MNKLSTSQQRNWNKFLWKLVLEMVSKPLDGFFWKMS